VSEAQEDRDTIYQATADAMIHHIPLDAGVEVSVVSNTMSLSLCDLRERELIVQWVMLCYKRTSHFLHPPRKHFQYQI